MSQLYIAPVYDARRVGELLGISYSERELAGFGPPPEPVKGFVTFFDPGWALLRLRRMLWRNTGTAKPVDSSQMWYYRDEDFAWRQDEPQFRQLRREAIPDSRGKAYAEQQKLLGADEEVPTARVVVTGMVIQYFASGERLYRDYWVRCRDELSGDRRTLVGNFDRDVLDIYYCRDDYCGNAFGLVSCRKI